MGFRKLFGLKREMSKSHGPPKKDKAAAEKAISTVGELDDNEKRLEKKRSLLEEKMGNELRRAQELNKLNKKQQALMALKKKKLYESQLQQTNNLILRLNEQKLMLENQRQTVEVVETMQTAASAAKQTMAAMNIEHVDDLMANIQEQNDEMLHVQEAVAQPTGMFEIDEGDLENELHALEEQTLDEEILAPAPIHTTPNTSEELTKLPAAPKATTTVQEELADLKEELAA